VGRSGNILLSSIAASLVLIVIAQYMLNVMLVVRPSPTARDDRSLSALQPPPPPPDSAAVTATTVVRDATTQRLQNERSSRDPRPYSQAAVWMLAQLPSILRRRVLEYFNPGRNPTNRRSKPRCPPSGKDPHGLTLNDYGLQMRRVRRIPSE